MKKSKLLEVTEELRKSQMPIHHTNIKHEESLSRLDAFDSDRSKSTELPR
jgi:hypothetical protein